MTDDGDWVVCVGPCWSCGQVFSFNPHRVPSIVVKGEREAICQNCVTRANRLRAQTGMPLIYPLPGAYDSMPAGDL